MTYPHWQYFLALDFDIDNISRYIEISKENYAVYSIELVRVILASSSEIDVVAKLLCNKTDSSKSYENINDYREDIMKKYPNFYKIKTTIPRYGLILEPWKDWSRGTNPKWWGSYNNVKHHRNIYYKEANLENALNSLAGLFALILYYHKEELYANKLIPWPRFFSLEEDKMIDSIYIGEYKLPDFS